MNNQVLDHPHVKESRHQHVECCPEIPELRRLQYFYGQMLTSADLQEEQRYFREKLRLINRCVHGHGVLCGLKVVPEPGEERCDPETDRRREQLEEQRQARGRDIEDIKKRLESAGNDAERQRLQDELKKATGEREEVERELDTLCPPDKEQRPSPRVTIECGIAIDCDGNEIIVRRPKTIDLFHYLNQSDLRRLREHGRLPLWVSICYCEMPVEPVRPVHTDSCQPADACRYGKIQDSYRITVTLDPPEADTRCEPCCCSCADSCVPLARIDPFAPHRPVPMSAIHNEVRRRFGLYDWVTVTGISWVHGGEYSSDEAALVLGRHDYGNGLEFRFSRPVKAETLREGVIDVLVVEGGRGRAGDIYNVPGRIHHPEGPLVDRVFFQQTSDDKFHDGDLLRIRLRADFVLDACCRPVDGNHIGGRVPLVAVTSGVTHPQLSVRECLEPPNWDGPWTSGNGAGGGLFESWIGIKEQHPRPDNKGDLK